MRVGGRVHAVVRRGIAEHLSFRYSYEEKISDYTSLFDRQGSYVSVKRCRHSER